MPRAFNNNPCASPSGSGWRAQLRPSNHPVSDFHFDVVIGADGRKSTLDGETETQNCGDAKGRITFCGSSFNWRHMGSPSAHSLSTIILWFFFLIMSTCK